MYPQTTRIGLLSRIGVLLAAFSLWMCSPAWAALGAFQEVVSGLNYPVYATHAPGDRDRLFVLEKNGDIEILDLTTNSISGTFLNIPDTDPGGEGGLVGMAFHPDYYNNGSAGEGKFYVYVTVDNGGVLIDGVTSPYSSHVREYSVSANPNVANPTSTEIMSWVQPRDNHNGGWIGFNPEVNPGDPQYLHINSGDGGKQGDPDGNAQDITNEWLGKVLRVDVNGDDFPGDATRNYAVPNSNPFVDETGDDEIWDYGLRNPWRAGFDRRDGDLYIGDVGQGAFEEINREAYGNPGGNNYGWNLYEGFDEYTANPGDPFPSDYLPPIHDYPHGNTPSSGNSTVGGYVYRGPDPDLQGVYFFADTWNDGNFWTLDPDNPGASVVNIESTTGSVTTNFNDLPVAFAEDAVGNLYVINYAQNWAPNTGGVFRIATDNLLAGDYNADGRVDDDDYTVWAGAFGSTTELAADGNGDSIVDGADYTVWRDMYGASVWDLPAPGAGAGSGGGASVPEPGSLLLVGQLITLLLYGRRRTAVSL